MVVHLCCKCLSPIFHLFFQTYIVRVFIWKMHMFHAYAANVFIWMLRTCCKSFQVFLQVFQTHVLNVSFVASGCFKTRSIVVSLSSPFCCLASVSSVGRRRRSPLHGRPPRACGQAQQTRCGGVAAQVSSRESSVQKSGR
jgi:hypothetical protein